MSKIILFDLDGTLTDSADGIIKSVQYALGHFGLEEPDENKLKCFVGPPLLEQFMEYCHMSRKQAEVAVSVYRERYRKLGMFENAVYPGIPELLTRLKEEKKILAVASSKPELYVRQILEHFQLDSYFDAIVGANMDGTRTDKAEVIEETLLRLGACDMREEVLMVGDRSHDVEGALKCGIQCIGAGYGYGGYEELEKAGAVYIAETVTDLQILSDEYRKERRRQEKERLAAQETNVQAMDEHQLRHGPIRKIWRVIYPLLTAFVITLVVSSIGSMLFYASYSAANAGADFETISDYIMSKSILLTGVADVLVMVPLLLFYRKDRKLRKNGFLGKRRNNGSFRKRGIYLVTIVFAVTASQLLNVLIDFSRLDELFPYYSELQASTFEGQNIFLILFVVGVAAPISEELIFRGLICKRLQDYLGNSLAVVLSALMFGIYHGNMVQFVYATLLGLAFGFLMCKTNCLKVTIAAHMAANIWSSLGGALFGWMEKSYVTAYYFALAIFCILALLSMVYLMSCKTDEKEKKN